MKFPTTCDETLAEAIDWSPLCLPGHLKASEAISLWQHYHQRRSDYKIGDIAPGPWALVLDKKNELIGLLPDWRLAAALWTEHFSLEIQLGELCLPFTTFFEFPNLPNFNTIIDFFEQHCWDILPIYYGEEKAWGILSIGNVVRQVNLCQLWQNLSLQVIADPPFFLSPDVTLGELIEHSFAQQISTFPILYSSPLLPPSTAKVPIGNARLAYYLNHFHHDSLVLESRVGDGISATFPLCVSNQNYCHARDILRQQNHDYVIVTQVNGEFAGWITPQQWLQTLQPDVLLSVLQQEIEVPRLIQHLEARIIWQQQQLQRSQHLIHKLLQHNPNLIYLYDLIHNQTIFLNHTSTVALGSTTDVSGEKTSVFREFQRPLLPLEHFTLESLICLEAHEKKEFNFELVNHQESIHYFAVEISVFEIDERGNTSKLLCVVRDITEGKQAKEDLQTKEQQLETLVNTVADGIVIVDSANTVIYANPVACGMFGITKEEFLQSQLGLSGKNQREISINLAEAEGVGEIKSVPIHWEGKDCRLVTVRDITDRQEVLKKLKESEQRYRILLETIPNLVWRLELEGKVWECNRQTSEFFGQQDEKILGDNWQNFLHPSEAFRVQYDWQEGLENSQFFQLECRLRRADGEYRWQLMQVLPFHTRFGQMTGWLVSSTDIDDLKQAEQTLTNQANQEKLLSSVGQRIRQSLQLKTILQITVMEVRRTMEADRVFVYQIEPNNQGKAVAESVIDQFDSVVDLLSEPEPFPSECYQHHLHNHIDVSDPDSLDCTENCPLRYLTTIGSKARMIAPIVFDHNLWGLLIVHQCAFARKWQPMEIQFMQSLADQLAIAIQQSLLYERLKGELSERKKTEQQLLEVNQLQKGIFDVANYIIVSTDNKGTINTFNRMAEKILGYGAEELIGKHTPFKFHDPEEIKTQVKKLSVELGQAISPNSMDVFLIPAVEWGVYEAEWTFIAKNGDRIPVYLSVTTLKDGQGHIDGLVGVANDLRKQKQMEKEKQNLDFVVKNSTELIVIADLEQKIFFLNEAGQKLVGLKGLGIAQKTYLSEYVSPEYLDLWQTEIIPDVMQNRSWEGEFSLQHYQTEQEIPVTASISLLRDDDRHQTSSLVAIMHDITHIKNAEKRILAALEKEKELGALRSRFISTTSHEFRTPLAVISSSTEIIQRYWQKLEAEKREQHLQRIQDSVHHMVELLDDVLTINRAEAKHLDFAPQVQDLLAFCQKITEELQSSTTRHSIVFTYNGVEPGEASLFDGKLLRQILTNLLSNAIKYSPNASEILFHLERHGPDAIFTVQDQGIGISPEELPKLFDNFYRAENVGTIPGTGLGLPIVKKCTEIHGGSVAVTSVLGEGSCFRVALPLWPAAENVAVVSPNC